MDSSHTGSHSLYGFHFTVHSMSGVQFRMTSLLPSYIIIGVLSLPPQLCYMSGKDWLSILFCRYCLSCVRVLYLRNTYKVNCRFVVTENVKVVLPMWEPMTSLSTTYGCYDWMPVWLTTTWTWSLDYVSRRFRKRWMSLENSIPFDSEASLKGRLLILYVCVYALRMKMRISTET